MGEGWEAKRLISSFLFEQPVAYRMDANIAIKQQTESIWRAKAQNRGRTNKMLELFARTFLRIFAILFANIRDIHIESKS